MRIHNCLAFANTHSWLLQRLMSGNFPVSAQFSKRPAWQRLEKLLLSDCECAFTTKMRIPDRIREVF